MSYSQEEIEKFKTERFYPKSKRAKDVKHELGYFGLGGDQKYNRVKRIVADVCRRAEESYTHSKEPGSTGGYWNPTDGSSITDEMKLYEDVERATSLPRYYIPWFINNHLRGIGRIHNPRGQQSSGQQQSAVTSPAESEDAVSPVSPTNEAHLGSLAQEASAAAAESYSRRRESEGQSSSSSRSANFWDTVMPDPRKQG